MNKFKIQVLEKRAICGDLFVVHAMADGTDPITCKGLLSLCFETVDLKCGKPLERVIPLLPLIVHFVAAMVAQGVFPAGASCYPNQQPT